jgi:hypothetical protein
MRSWCPSKTNHNQQPTINNNNINHHPGIKLPFLTFVMKNLNRYTSIEVHVVDDMRVRRRLRASNYQVRARACLFVGWGGGVRCLTFLEACACLLEGAEATVCGGGAARR